MTTTKHRELLLELPFPPSLNTYYRHVGPRVLMSAKGRQFRTDVQARVLTACKGNPEPFTGRLFVVMSLHNPANRDYDVDNRPKALLDALEWAGCYGNDNQIDALLVVRGTKVEGGKCDVWLREIDDTGMIVRAVSRTMAECTEDTPPN